jgi:hypothetical protein
MQDAKIHHVTKLDVIRGARAPVPIAAAHEIRRERRRPRPPAGSSSPGRAWINGREVGGGDPRFDHLAISHD